MLRNASTSAGVWVTVISVLMQIPLWFLATSASDFHDLVWGFPELFEPPYSPYIKPSSALAYGLSVVAIVWTIVSAFCGCAGPNINGRYYLFSGLLYAGLVSACFTAAYLQSTFLPKPLGKCWNADIWPYNQTYNTSAPTLFEVLGGNATAAGDRCSDLTFVWELEITMGILLTVNCLITWILAVKVFLSVTRNRPYEPSGSLAGDIWWFLKYFMLTPLLCPFKLLWWPVEPLVVKVFSGLRYWFRYREKKLQYLEVTEEIAMGSYPKQTTDLESQNESPLLTMVELYKKNQIVYDRRRSTMEVVLSCYNPVLDSILTGLHYVDIVNLGLVSETIRNALDTKSDEALKRAACVDGTETARYPRHSSVPLLPTTLAAASSSAPNAFTNLAAIAGSPRVVLNPGLPHVPDTTRIVPRLESYVKIAFCSTLTAFLQFNARERR
ncbi:hypothetical protein MMC27_000996 [Xylographa pallens]|nr:hypothetical protein [Xylographa pallens]